MDDLLIVRDRFECHGPRTVFFGVCSICLAEFDEWHAGDPGDTADAIPGAW